MNTAYGELKAGSGPGLPRNLVKTTDGEYEGEKGKV